MTGMCALSLAVGSLSLSEIFFFSGTAAAAAAAATGVAEGTLLGTGVAVDAEAAAMPFSRALRSLAKALSISLASLAIHLVCGRPE